MATNDPHNTNPFYRAITANNTSGLSIGGHAHAGPSTSVFPYSAPHVPPSPPLEGVDELAEMLGVEPAVAPLGAIIIVGVSGNQYSLVDMLRAQVEFMTLLSTLLVHRNLFPEE